MQPKLTNAKTMTRKSIVHLKRIPKLSRTRLLFVSVLFAIVATALTLYTRAATNYTSTLTGLLMPNTSANAWGTHILRNGDKLYEVKASNSDVQQKLNQYQRTKVAIRLYSYPQQGVNGTQRILAANVDPVAYFQFTTNPPPKPDKYGRLQEETDLVTIEVRNDTTIQRIRNILSGTNKDSMIHVEGYGIKGKTAYNPNYSFYLEPDSIVLFQAQIEFCDASVQYFEKGMSIAPDGTKRRWCPWGSRFVKEVPYLVP